MGLWIRTDTDALEITNADGHPEHGEWIEAGEALRMIREYNERKAREEQTKRSHVFAGKDFVFDGPGFDPTGEGSACYNTGMPVETETGDVVANPIPANEGDGRVAESVAIPVGWVKSLRHVFTSPHGWRPLKIDGRCVGVIEPDPSIPWGEGYEAILPSEARNGGSCEYWCNTGGHGTWTPAYNVEKWEKESREDHPWRRKVQPEAESLADRVADSIAEDAQIMRTKIDILRGEVARLQEERDAAVGRAVMAERARAELLADLQRILQEVPTTTVEKESA